MESSPWTPLTKVPIDAFTSTIKINENEFILAPYNSISQFSDDALIYEMYKYNIDNNEWSVFMKDADEHSSRALFGMKSNNNELYLCQPQSSSGDLAKMSRIDIKNKKFIEIIETKQRFGTNPSALMINDRFHVISGSGNNKHFIWNDDKNQFDEVGTNKYWDGLQCVQFEYIPSQNILLSFGGYSNSDTICKTSLDKIDWKLLYTVLPITMSQVGTILTMDEKWLIMFGGGFSNSSKQIYALQLNEWKFYKSSIKMPFSGSSCAQLMSNINRNGLIINGYIRNVIYNKDINEPFMPNDIINLLVKWYSLDEIYLIRDGHGSQWRIEVNDIVNTLTPC